MGVVANYKPGFNDEIVMGHLEAFREVRVLDTQQSGVYPRGDPRNGWVLVVDAHLSESAEESISERDVWWPNCLDTAMVSVEGFKSSDDNIGLNARSGCARKSRFVSSALLFSHNPRWS